MFNLDIFDKNDWAHLHDVVLETMDKSLSKEELIIIFNNLPSDLQHMAYEWGMNDTVFRDLTYEHLEKK